MNIQVTVAQPIPMGSFRITLTGVSDDDAKEIMTTAPNASFTLNGNVHAIKEANPVHLIPNALMLTLETKLLSNLKTGDILTIN